MSRTIIPLGNPEDSLEAHLTRHSRRTQAIYLTIVTLVLCVITALPFVRVNLSVQGMGIIRPETDKHEVRAAASGFVETVNLHRSASVKAGDPLLQLETGGMVDRIEELKERIAETAASIADLEELIEPDRKSAPRLNTEIHAGEYAQYEAEIAQALALEKRAENALARAQELGRRGLIPRTEIEEAESAAIRAQAERLRIETTYPIEWARALTAARRQLTEFRDRIEHERESSTRLLLRAPVSGTLEEVANISPGSYLHAGDRLAVISPDADLFAEVFIAPRDIGRIVPGTPARLLLDAFNYNDWGSLPGRVTAVADDFSIVDQQPVFRVAVQFEERMLKLPTGARGEVRKGMTLQARFMVAERTLWQLLRDKIDNRLNPAAPS